MVKFNLLKTISENNKMFLLYGDRYHYGKCGTPTQIIDICGNRLFVGDVVYVESNRTDYHCFESVVVNYEDNIYTIMGIVSSYINNFIDWKITKIIPYFDVKCDTEIKNIWYKNEKI